MYRTSILVERCSGTWKGDFHKLFPNINTDTIALFLDLLPLSSGMIPSVPSTVLRTPSSCSRCVVSKSESYPDVEPKMVNSSRSRMVYGNWSTALLRRGPLRHISEYLSRVRRTSTTGSDRFWCPLDPPRSVKSCEYTQNHIFSIFSKFCFVSSTADISATNGTLPW